MKTILAFAFCLLATCGATAIAHEHGHHHGGGHHGGGHRHGWSGWGGGVHLDDRRGRFVWDWELVCVEPEHYIEVWVETPGKTPAGHYEERLVSARYEWKWKRCWREY